MSRTNPWQRPQRMHRFDRRILSEVEGLTMQLSRRRMFATVVGSGGSVAFLAACGNKGKGAKQPTTANNGQAGKPRYGGQLNSATAGDPGNGGSFDPAKKRTDGTYTLEMTNSSLIGYKTGAGVKYTDVVLQPDLATHWESPDAQSYTFHLHEPVKFANLPPLNGRELSSADVKWSYEYLSGTGDFKNSPKPGTASLLAGLERVETPDPSTAVVRFAQPFAPFLTYAASPFLPIVAYEIFDQDGDFTKRVVGTGPFQLDVAATEHGKRWVWKKNPSYFQEKLPYLDQINWLIVPDDATQQAAFETKQIDLLTYRDLNLDSVEQIQRVVPNVVVYDYLDHSSNYIYLNVTKSPLDDARIRKALALSVNRDELIKALANGKGEWALAASLPGLFTEDETKQILKFDLSGAKQLLSAAGYANGVDIQLMFRKYSDSFLTLMQLFQAQAKKAGINIKLQEVGSGVDSGRRRTGDYQLAITPDPPGFTPDPDSFLYPLFYPGDPGNRGNVNDPQLTPLLEAQRREADPTKRRKIIRQAVQRINEVPWALSLYYGTSYELWHPYLKNYAPNIALDQRVNESWLEK